MLRVAILSSWHVHADGYAKEFTAQSGVTLTAMWDELPKRGIEFAAKYGMDFVPDLDVLLARDDVDAVCVTTPTNLHKDVIIKAAKAGKHIFTEKVLAFTTGECAEIVRAVKEAGVKFCISFPHRTMPRNLFAKQVMDFLMDNMQISKISILGDLKNPREKDNSMGTALGFAHCMAGGIMPEKHTLQV